ncbi:MAG: hypothetical protein PF482_05720 [Desulfobacteraceae bacterium]|jgi:hypothetical protein|nr:hypothetical protein [Desulfobacteraceae bacterium]
MRDVDQKIDEEMMSRETTNNLSDGNNQLKISSNRSQGTAPALFPGT